MARARAFGAADKFKRQTVAPAGLSTPGERLDFVAGFRVPARTLERLLWPLLAGVIAAMVPAGLLRGIADKSEVDIVLGGMPHNVTTEMDLALWRLAHDHREVLGTPTADELVAMYRDGTLPDIGLPDFLDRYGHRAAAEIDIGVPRWEEDPAPVLAAIANYLLVTDPEEAPDRRFSRAAATAQATLAELLRRARRRPIRRLLAGFFLRRARALAGLREIGKFAGLYPLRERRRQLLLVGDDLVSEGRLECAEDIMFLDLEEARAAVRGEDLRATVAARQAVHERETRRRRVPIALLSDGTDVEAAAPASAEEVDGLLRGVPAAPGAATGPARVVGDPAGAVIRPGEILVAPTTDPGWTPLFLTAGALVTEVGAPMAHGPTVAREYGIPAVVCVRDATQEIKTGQIITVDGSAGTVRLGG